jgi:hypothetical protein
MAGDLRVAGALLEHLMTGGRLPEYRREGIPHDLCSKRIVSTGIDVTFYDTGTPRDTPLSGSEWPETLGGQGDRMGPGVGAIDLCRPLLPRFPQSSSVSWQLLSYPEAERFGLRCALRVLHQAILLGGARCRNVSRSTPSFRYGTTPRRTPGSFLPYPSGSLFSADVGPFCAPITRRNRRASLPSEMCEA